MKQYSYIISGKIESKNFNSAIKKMENIKKVLDGKKNLIYEEVDIEVIDEFKNKKKINKKVKK